MAKDKEQQQMTMEEYLLSQLDMPAMAQVRDKDGKPTGEFKPIKAEDGHEMTKNELIATTILNNAMKGDLKAATYIQQLQIRANLTKKK